MSQVVHDYGDICQTITALAVEQRAPISVKEFHTLNRCLDTAIAEAVTEHARVTAAARSAEETERLGNAAHELRDTLNAAILAFHALKRGAVAINGSTGAVLGRSLMSLREVIDRTLSHVRLEAGKQTPVRLPVVAFIDDITATGALHSEYRHIQFTVEPIDPALSIDADPQLLTSAVMNLLHNAFKNTPSGGRVVLRADPQFVEKYTAAPNVGGYSSRRKTSVAGFLRARAICFRCLATVVAATGLVLAWDSRSLGRRYGHTVARSAYAICPVEAASSPSKCHWQRKSPFRNRSCSSEYHTFGHGCLWRQSVQPTGQLSTAFSRPHIRSRPRPEPPRARPV